MNLLPKSVIDNIEVLNSYFKKYNINNVQFINTINKIKYIENFNLDKYGMFDWSNYKLTINPEKKDDGKKVISHELIHTAGGFNKHVGFNEFSTQYINTIIFGAKKGHFEKNDFKMLDKIVKIVGFDTFFKCYLLRNFDLFIENLKKYYDYKDCYNLVNILDKYYSWFTNLESRMTLDKNKLERDFKKIIKRKIIKDKVT